MPLPPGNEQVISTDRFRREQPERRAPRETPVEAPPAPPSEYHCLEVEEGALPEELIVVESSSVKIGRKSPADIVLPHSSISREHCSIGLANDELLVTDLNSTNGTYIDDVRIIRAAILPVGSVLRLGQVAMRHTIHPHAEAERRGALSGANRGLHSQRIAATH